MFKIIGGDGKEYGPVAAETIRDWLRQGRADGNTRVLPEGATDWVELRAVPEFHADLAAERPPQVRPPTPPAAHVALTPGPRSGLATTSLVLGILGWLTLGVTALVGLVLGIVALVRINNSQGRLGGKGVATAGIVTSAIALLLVPVMAITLALVLPALAKAKSRSGQIMCMTNLKQLDLGVRMYANDHQDRFPAATNWCDAISFYLPSSQPFQCAKAPGLRSGYAYNAAVAGLELDAVNPQTVVLFESRLDWNGSGNAGFATPRHDGQRIGVAFADGHVEFVPLARVPGLRWNP